MKEEKIFEITGTFLEGSRQKGFVKKVMAVNEQFAAEKILSMFGSKHRVKRRDIEIREVKEAKNGEKD